MNLKELTPVTAKKYNRVMESRFGFSLDYDNMSLSKAKRLSTAISEQLNKIRQSYGAHSAERNPKYMEMLMVQEGLKSYLKQNYALMEGELETAEAVLAAKDMVDSVQDMITDASKMLNEQLPPLLDTIRDQVGVPQADSFKNTVTSALQGLMDSLNTARDALDQGSRQLAGEDVGQSMDMGGGMPPEGAAGALPAPEENDLDQADGFDATDAAAGGAEDLGRERR